MVTNLCMIPIRGRLGYVMFTIWIQRVQPNLESGSLVFQKNIKKILLRLQRLIWSIGVT